MQVKKSPTLVPVNAAALRALRADVEWCVCDLWLPGAPAMVPVDALDALMVAFGAWVAAQRRASAWDAQCRAWAKAKATRETRWPVARRAAANKAEERQRLDVQRAYAKAYGEPLRVPPELEREAYQAFRAAVAVCVPVRSRACAA